jgi:hypothetical protein
MDLLAIEGSYAVCRIPPGRVLPDLGPSPRFCSITRTSEELSVVCPIDCVQPEWKVEGSWRCLRVAGTLDFALVGVLAALLSPLAEAGIPVFVTSTFDSDYLMIRQPDFERALRALRAAGHRVTE